ncbi:hypothetical protein [Sphingobacterium bovistauri]|uniref:Uncharacterized protein n=1 Tax=Sphingobacterium bovistauri TaxID=2781959 RepID=A0ABS7Z510_9SPHI|nr:hypothetical protein [Sphingobacterium bovistauri]MCA5005227.1 hypothetical protein [Sphingobacterium bovistauri]
MKTKVIKDIRLYESNQPNVSENSLPGELGKLMHSDTSFTFWAIRIARKLNELQFTLLEADHLYINFTNCLETDQLQISDRKPTSWIQYVDVQINFEEFNTKSLKEQENNVVEAIFRALNLIANEEQKNILDECLSIIKEQAKKTEIHYKTKETKSYKVEISYQIAPDDKTSVMLVKYIDKIVNIQQVFQFPIRFYEDVYALVDKINVVKNSIILIPKKSFKAELYSKFYQTPLHFELN